jgi:hypothetical protein
MLAVDADTEGAGAAEECSRPLDLFSSFFPEIFSDWGKIYLKPKSIANERTSATNNLLFRSCCSKIVPLL